MTPELRAQIIGELRTFLNREPMEHEIMNAQTDHGIMGRIRDKKIQIAEVNIENIADAPAIQSDVTII